MNKFRVFLCFQYLFKNRLKYFYSVIHVGYLISCQIHVIYMVSPFYTKDSQIYM